MRLPTRLWIGEHSVHIISICTIGACALYSLWIPEPQYPVLEQHVGTKVRLEGTVGTDVDAREKVWMFTLRTQHGDVLVSTEPYSARIAYGDTVRVEGKLKEPRTFVSSASTTVDYGAILAVRGLYYTMSYAKVTPIRSGEGESVYRALFDMKAHLMHTAEGLLPRHEAALLTGMLLGSARGMGDALTEQFREAGLVHIVVLSGYNISLVMQRALAVFEFVLPRTASLAGAGLIGVVFVLMAGASGAAVRALLMALIVLVAEWLRRPSEALRILLVVAAGMALYNPLIVLNDASYQLSVLATLGLVTMSKWFEGRITLVPQSLGLREVVASTLAVEVAILPILILSFNQVPLLSVVANALVLPTVPYTMLAGFVAIALGTLSYTLAMPAALVAYIGLRFAIIIAAVIASIPFATLTL